MIARGSTNWDLGLSGACIENRINIIKMMIDRGATICACGKSIDNHIK
jgi:hypothetical protein